MFVNLVKLFCRVSLKFCGLSKSRIKLFFFGEKIDFMLHVTWFFSI